MLTLDSLRQMKKLVEQLQESYQRISSIIANRSARTCCAGRTSSQKRPTGYLMVVSAARPRKIIYSEAEIHASATAVEAAVAADDVAAVPAGVRVAAKVAVAAKQVHHL